MPTSLVLVLAVGVEVGAGLAGLGLVGVVVAVMVAGGLVYEGDSTNSFEKARGEERSDERREEGG